MMDTEGIIYLTFEAKDPKDMDYILSIIDEEIEKYSQIGFTQDQIDNIITREKASRLLSTPGVDSECNRIGWNLLRNGTADNFDNRLEQLERLTTEDLQQALIKHVVPKNRVLFYAMPEGTSQQLEEADQVAVNKEEIQKVEVSNAITLLHRFNNEKPLIRGIIQLPIDTNYETADNAGSLDFMTQLMFSGSKNYAPLDLSEWLEDHSVDMRYRTDANGTNISFKCLKDDYPVIENIIIDAFE